MPPTEQYLSRVIRIGNQRHDVAAVVFDKDGTLVHFGELWSSIMQRWTEAVLPEDAPMTVRQQLHDALGVTADGRLIPNGVAHSGTLEQMRTTTADVLSRHDPESAQEVVQGSADILETFEDHEIVPIGDVTKALRALSRAGIGVAVATSDDRSPAERQLEHLGIADIVDVMVCGDDEIAP